MIIVQMCFPSDHPSVRGKASMGLRAFVSGRVVGVSERAVGVSAGGYLVMCAYVISVSLHVFSAGI